ncbi:MAG: PilZ domain-containing protein [Phycisphaerales bacterium]|nr:PilZ domain-containing protein [Phycisphaerales bacterium]
MTHNVLFAEPKDETLLIGSWLAEAREEGCEDVYAGKRRHARVQWNAPVIVQPEDGSARTYYVTALNISAGGMGLRCGEAISPRTRLRLFVNDGVDSVIGVVRHCSSTVGGYIVGVEFVLEQKQVARLAKTA